MLFTILTALGVVLLTALLFVLYADRILPNANDDKLVPVEWAENIFENKYYSYSAKQYCRLFKFYTLVNRMLIVQLKDGTLVIHNPTKLTPILKKTIDSKFGENCKKYIIIPCTTHIVFYAYV